MTELRGEEAILDSALDERDRYEKALQYIATQPADAHPSVADALRVMQWVARRALLGAPPETRDIETYGPKLTQEHAEHLIRREIEMAAELNQDRGLR